MSNKHPLMTNFYLLGIVLDQHERCSATEGTTEVVSRVSIFSGPLFRAGTVK